MDTNIRKLPIGVQDFESIRQDGYLYVDKTQYIYELMTTGKPYFLSRPRRFGKSLLLSTMKAYFEGKRELFEGLAITELTKGDPDAFAQYPVFYFDFNGATYSNIIPTSPEIGARISSVLYGAEELEEEDSPRKNSSVGGKHGSDMSAAALETAPLPMTEALPVEIVLDEHLRRWEDIYGSDPRNITLSSRFRYLLRTATERTGRRAVVLVDEYDKPLLEENPKFDELNRLAFKGFFGNLKSEDALLRFVFITGVTKFSKVSIFSDLNHLVDISLNKKYTGICGITEAEMKETFMPEIEHLASSLDITTDKCMSSLKKMYDGYHFHQNSPGIYNPFSLINAFSAEELGSFWFETGTPTFLITKLKAGNFDPKRITEEDIYADASVISNYRIDNPNPIPLLYQSGYLTIAGYEKETAGYLLDYPNDEVKYGFLRSLTPLFLREDETDELDIRAFYRDIKKADTDSIRNRFTALFARLPYPSGTEEEIDRYIERDFQNVIYITFMLLGQFIHTEVHNATGRADAAVETADYIYLFEFKRDKSAEEALQQINDKNYAAPYAADSRKLLKIGVNFDTAKRNISEWVVE